VADGRQHTMIRNKANTVTDISQTALSETYKALRQFISKWECAAQWE